ncbi:MAG: hypothetical protein ABL977_01795 [Candidatus Eisenbacteria bacterium]
MRRSILRTILALAGSALLAGSAFSAPVELDAPDATVGIAASSLVHVDVVAGASGAPNGFTIEWMTRAHFDALGAVWPDDPSLDPAVHVAVFLGNPTLNTVDGTTTFLLAPGAAATIQLGDIFDETGVVAENADASEMSPGTEYVFRVMANGDAGGTSGGGAGLYPSSPYSGTYSCWTKHHDDNHDCVHTQGYWKNHPSAWPVSTVRLGSVIYTKTQALAILNQPANGNGLVSLAHQLIAAKLNVAAGAIPGTLISGVIATADALIGAKVAPPIGAGFIAPRTASRLTDDLEEFNDDEMEHHDCQVTTAIQPKSWGQLKAMYR